MRIYQDCTQSAKARAKDLLSIMTIKEKIGQLYQNMHGWNAYKIQNNEVVLTKAFQKEVAYGDGLGAIYGISRADGWNSHLTMGIHIKESIRVANAIQKYVIDNTRLGIPAFFSEECSHGHEALEATTFPTNIGVGSTWNPELYERMCAVIRKELRARGGHLALISSLDITTDPRWGRTEECYSEDPYLSGTFCERAVWGIQGHSEEQLPENAIAVLKHFCAQGATIGGHNGRATNIGQRELHEIHLKGMRKGIKAGALGCMAAYNDIDGVPCHINKKLLTDILRNEMGFQGFVMSDGKAVDRLKAITGSFEKAGAKAIQAGVDMDLWNVSFQKLGDAVEHGFLNETDLDRAVERILYAKFAMGLYEHPFIEEDDAESVIGNEEAKQVALQMARESVVLLKNEKHILPLTPQYKKIAVIGPNADNIYNQLGDYTAWQTEEKVTTILRGILQHASPDAEVSYAHGCGVRGKSKSEFDEAITLTRNSDVVLLVLGGSSTREAGMTFEDNGAVFMNRFTSELDCGEAVDLANISLGGVQQELAMELKKTGTPIITILIQGRPHAIPWFAENADAILCAWYPGEKGGDAIGEIVFGKTNPSGKLSVSIPYDAAQLPVFYNRKDASAYADMSSQPLYPFGYGLSYTSFSYTDFFVNKKEIGMQEILDGKAFEITFSVKNTGQLKGKTTPQLYIHDMEACVTRRIKELKDFAKIELEPQETKKVSLSVNGEELGVYDYSMNYVIEPGNIKLMIGDSCENIIYETIVTIGE